MKKNCFKNKICFKLLSSFYILLAVSILSSCNNYFKNDYRDNSPTSGQLKVYFDEGLEKHVTNQAYTFEAIYSNANLELVNCTENEAIEGLYNDSCEAIVISRQLNPSEKKAFASKKYEPKFSIVAISGLAIITNISTKLKAISIKELKQILDSNSCIKDSLGDSLRLKILLDRNNSSIVHYVLDSITKRSKLNYHCNALNSTRDALAYVAENKNTIALIDFAWLSDIDDTLTKHYNSKIKILGVMNDQNVISFPNQSSFKTGTYPFCRSIYVYRKTGDFTLAKGFESFVAGPKGQITFLKQGLLPSKQQERMVNIKLESINLK